jgi:hypothetical protein
MYEYRALQTHLKSVGTTGFGRNQVFRSHHSLSNYLSQWAAFYGAGWKAPADLNNAYFYGSIDAVCF